LLRLIKVEFSNTVSLVLKESPMTNFLHSSRSPGKRQFHLGIFQVLGEQLV
jgi:hypothetical protein